MSLDQAAVRTIAALARIEVADDELDHLAGVLIIDYLNPIKKMLLKRRP